MQGRDFDLDFTGIYNSFHRHLSRVTAKGWRSREEGPPAFNPLLLLLLLLLPRRRRGAP